MNIEKEKRAIEYLKAFEPKEEPYFLCYSGGKDSDVVRILRTIAKDALELIKHQKAEIERLKDKIFVLENDLEKAENLNDALGNDIDIKLNHIYDLEEKLAKAKSEAVKEFAKFLVDNKIDVVDLTAEFLRRGESDA